MATGFSFGGPAASTAPSTGFAFGAAAVSAAPSTGLTFGAPAASAAPSTGLTFGGPAASTAPSTGFAFGAAAASTAPSTGFAFGGPAASTAPSTGFGFGGPAAAASTVPSTGLAFGAPAVSTAQLPGFAFGGQAASTAPSTGLAFGAPALSTAPSTGFAFGTAAPTAAAPATTSAPPPFGAATSGLGGLGGLATTTSTAGLGGTANPLAGSIGASATDPKSDIKTLKEAPIPAPLAQTVEDFKKYVKEERSVSSDITHISSKIHQKIRSDTDLLLTLVKTLASEIARCKSQMNRLKVDVAQDLINVEIAQRTRDTPPALQYENTAPYEYFAQLVSSFEAQMIYYKRQIEETEHYLQTMTTQGSLSIDDITKAIARMQDTFTNLAGRFQKIHEAVQKQKDLFVHAYRVKHGMAPEIFVRKERPVAAFQGSVPAASTLGPSPFSDHHDLLAMARASLSARLPNSQQPSFPVGTSSAPPTFGLSNAGAFSSWSTPKPVSMAATTNTLSSLTSTPGLLGSTMSPFSNSPTSSLFQGGGKRGKF